MTDAGYRDELIAKSGTWWKRVLPVQLPYRVLTRALCRGKTLEIGCGIGRNLEHLRDRGAVGVDPNGHSVRYARDRGLLAFEPAEFAASSWARLRFYDSLLFAHVAEHVSSRDFVESLRRYLPYLNASGTVVCVTPQERGFASDSTHVRFVDFEVLERDLQEAGLRCTRAFSFPFRARRAGRLRTTSSS